jgi:hypothetical protein
MIHRFTALATQAAWQTPLFICLSMTVLALLLSTNFPYASYLKLELCPPRSRVHCWIVTSEKARWLPQPHLSFFAHKTQT